MADELRLNCWILGFDDADAFPVGVLRSRTVAHLKDAIKKMTENALDRIDADQLNIWKASYPARRTRHC